MTKDRVSQIVNDIAEETNYRFHAKQEYRDVIAWLVDELCEERRKTVQREDRKWNGDGELFRRI